VTEDIGKEFLRKTMYGNLPQSDQDRGLPQPPLTLGPDPGQTLFDLPAPAEVHVPPLDLREAIERRRTLREYADRPLSLGELSYLLWCTQGVHEITSRPATRRTVPSAGARHAFETYLLINRVEGVKPGLYRYIAVDHKLGVVNLSDGVADQITAACLDQKHIKPSAVLFIWVAVAYRMLWRYPVRGYRYLFMDAGHVCQNLYLAAESIGCGVCAIGAYSDQALNSVLGVDGEDQFAIYAATVGKRG
jgi:SagB-type dehydrogenase family enzyme